MPRQKAVYNAASAAAAVAESAWDSDNVAYVGMEYFNTGACSQRGPATLNPHEDIRGCSQTKTAPVDFTTSRKIGELLLARWPGPHVEPSM